MGSCIVFCIRVNFFASSNVIYVRLSRNFGTFVNESACSQSSRGRAEDLRRI